VKQAVFWTCLDADAFPGLDTRVAIVYISVCGKPNDHCGGTKDIDDEGASTRLGMGFDGLGTEF
jgi:hypothetical protein